MRLCPRLILPALVLALLPAIGSAQFAEQNVNMVSGREWPGGDPFLQRQNEGSVAVSTRNPLHLLALANDYRTVDIPFDEGTRPDGEDTGDAWIGFFQSPDGGRTWRSVMLEGYPQQTFSTSPLHGYQAAADPVVRAADHGLFFASGIVLNRDVNPLGGVFVARFIDNNNTESSDPIVPLGVTMIDKGTSGQFIDKPWIAVAPQPNGTQCTVNGQTFAAQNVYLAYTIFVGNDNNIRTKLMFARSTDCGATWSTPTKLSEGIPINQGATVAVAPDGKVFVLWRRFKTNTDTDAIMIVKSADQGQTFTKGSVVVSITPFEQGTTTASIRTNAYPAATVDSTGRLYLVWSARSGPVGYGATPANDGRIMIMNSADGVTWTPPVQVDPSPMNGHQFMPSIAATGGKLTVAYYDLREDSTLGGLKADGSEQRAGMGDLPSAPQYVFTTFLQELAHHRRHTLDVRAAQALSGTATPLFLSTRISSYAYGNLPPLYLPSKVCPQVGVIRCIEQLQVNPPNFPLFRQGTVPFIGDYIDIAGYGGTTNNAAVQHVVWTDNRDVRPPLNGDWTNYTPVGIGTNRTSVFNGQQVPNCVAGQAGMRNQNIYTTRLTEGLFAGSATNFKQLNIERAFTVFVQNTRKQQQSYHLAIQAPGGTIASFLQGSVQTELDITVTARSTATRTVFIAPNPANPHASVTVLVAETGTGSPLSATVVLNPDVSNPDVSNPDVSNSEVHNPDVSNPDVSNPDVSNGNFQTPDVSNPDVSNPDVSNPDVSNPDVSNPDVSNPDVSNPDVSNSSLTDTTWTAKNNGNTTTGYNVKLVSNGPPATIKTQLLINRIYQTPIARNCTLSVENHRQIIANIPTPTFSDGGDLLDPLAKPGEGTYWLGPNETIRITLRVFDPDKTDNVKFDAASEVQLTVVSQAINSNGQAPPIATSLEITTASLPAGTFNQPYGPATLQAVGGVGAYTWTALKGLPAGLSVEPSTGVISGTPTAAADTFTTFKVTDSANPPHTATRTIPMHIEWGGYTATAHLEYNGLPLTPSTNPDMFAKDIDNNFFLQDAQIVWNGDDTVTIYGLSNSHYVLEVASKESAPAKYYPGGFWAQASFQIASANTDVNLTERRLIHVTSPADNATTFAAYACPPSLSVTPTQIAWQPIEIADVTYTYSVFKFQCSPNTGVLVTSGSTTSTSVPLTLSPTLPGEYYTIQLDAYSGDFHVGQIMSVGTNWYGWDVRFTVP